MQSIVLSVRLSVHSTLCAPWSLQQASLSAWLVEISAYSVGCSCDGQLIASAGEDQKCVVASVADGSVVTALRVPKAAGEHGRTS